MSRKRTKQYLMLLTVAGMLAIAAGGSGTFASFNAEVTNTGNTFANGTLLLHDNGGTNTCTSESASNNFNNGTGDTCDTFFNSLPLSLAQTTLAAGATAGTSTSIELASVATLAIQVGDQLTISNGTNSDVVTATSVGAVGSSVSVNVTWNASTGTVYTTSATVTRNSVTAYANLTLTNAGTLNAQNIEYGAPDANGVCTTTNTGSTTTVTGSSTGSGPYSIPVDAIPSAIRSGQTITLTHSGTSTTYTTSAAANTGATAISVTTNPSAVTSDTITWGPEFGGNSLDVCGNLDFVVIETDSSFDHNSTTHALGCAAGTLDSNNATDGLGCTFGGSLTLSSLTTTLTPLTLVSAANSNSGTQLSAGKSRYFVIGVRLGTVASSNDYQGRTASFGIAWQINQA